MITIFYDGKCGLCSKEINHYRKIAPDGIFDWQDINMSSQSLTIVGVNLTEGLKLLHAMDDDERLYVGVDAFVLIWKQLPRWKILSFLVSVPLIRQIVNFIYKAFANWRFNRLSHCQLSLTTKNAKC